MLVYCLSFGSTVQCWLFRTLRSLLLQFFHSSFVTENHNRKALVTSIMNKWNLCYCYMPLHLTSTVRLSRGKNRTNTNKQHQAGNLVCTHLKKLRKLINDKSMELDEYDQGEDLVRKEAAFRRCFPLLLLELACEFQDTFSNKETTGTSSGSESSKRKLALADESTSNGWNGNSTRR